MLKEFTYLAYLISQYDYYFLFLAKNLNHNRMSTIFNLTGHFLLGLFDSLSLSWIKGILFYTDPMTKRILPQSIKLQKVLLRSIVQAGVVTTLVPIILKWFGFTILGITFYVLSLIWTYIYLAFYNMDAIKLTQ